MKRLIGILAAVMLLTAVSAAPVAAVPTCSTGTYLTFYDGSNATGRHSQRLCTDYGFAWSFDQGAIRYTSDNVNVDNTISSVKFDAAMPNDYTFYGYTGYYFNGTRFTIAPGASLVVNLPSGLNNAMSSWKNLGQ